MASTTDADFNNFYLQRTTQEFAQDLDKARRADDFKADSVPFLVHALQQGAALFSDADKARVVRPAAGAAAVAEEEAEAEAQADPVEEGGKKKRKEKRKSEGRS